MNPPPSSLLLYQCPSRRLAGRLCAQLRRRHHGAVCQLYQGSWVVISQAREPDLFARYGAIPLRVAEQTVMLLLSGVKRPQRESCIQEGADSPALALHCTNRRRGQFFFPFFLKKP